MTEKLTITNERIDDIPVLLAQLERMQVAKLLDKHFPTHGNWQGLSLGTVATVWLTFILTEANHRLSHVQDWAEQRLNMLAAGVGQGVRALDLSDDRLPVILDELSNDQAWGKFERGLNRRTLRVYDLQPERVRIDSTTAKGYVDVSDNGLFQFGHSKDHRPDLPQLKINISVLDPLGLPLTTTVLSGEAADDPLYIPEIKRVQQSLNCQGVTYIGDSKMAALQTRAYVVGTKNYYLCPLSKLQLNNEELAQLLKPVWDKEQALTAVYRDKIALEPELIAEGFGYNVTLTSELDGSVIKWRERRLVIRSLQYAQSQGRALDERVAKACEDIGDLNRRAQGKQRFSEEAQLQQAVDEILSKYQVAGLIGLNYQSEVIEKQLRRYGTRPATTKVEHSVRVNAARDEAALVEVKRSLGWRVYATNQGAKQLSLEQAVLAYRAEYLVEAAIGRLKGKPLSLTPIYLETDNRIIGLVRLLMIGLRVLTLLEFTARKQLHQADDKLAGIYPGNPKRATERPTTEMMLRAFEGLTLTLITEADRIIVHVTPLSAVQQRILQLFGFSADIYLRLSQHFSKPALNLSEP
jgi:transposase